MMMNSDYIMLNNAFIGILIPPNSPQNIYFLQHEMHMIYNAKAMSTKMYLNHIFYLSKEENP